MNKVEALKACLDGKTVRSTLTGGVLRYDGGTFTYNGLPIPSLGRMTEDSFDLYVEPPREVTRAEAWAALDEGKVVKLESCQPGPVLVRLDPEKGLMFRDDPKHQSPIYRGWTAVRSLWNTYCNVYTDTKFYILEGEP